MFCAVVIAASTFTMAVEYVYGWSKVGPHAAAAWGYADQLANEAIGVEARAENAAPAEGTGAADTILGSD
jgi:hypothetical protein